MEPVTMALVIAYFLLRRGGENAMWLARRDGADPPSFRRWQERQKRKSRKSGREPITDRREARRFWAHLWHDAFASAHEWRQRRHGRRMADRRKRWQRKDIVCQFGQQTAPCVFCGAGRGEPCRPDCPEVVGHVRNRARGGARATVPPAPSRATVPPTEPTGTVPPAATVPPARSTTVPANRATEPAATVPPAAPANHAIGGGDTKSTTNPPTGNTSGQPHDDLAARRAEKTAEPLPPVNGATDSTNGDSPGEKMTSPAHRNDTYAQVDGFGHTRASINGLNIPSTPAPTGEFAGFDATVAGWNQIVEMSQRLDAAYEQQMAALRGLKADPQTLARAAAAREQNENHMQAARAAGNDWVKRQGAVKEAKEATGAKGDQAMHEN